MIALPAVSHFCFTTRDLQVSPLQQQHFTLYEQLYSDEKLMTHIATPLNTEQAYSSFVSALKLNAAMPAKRLFLVINAPDIDICQGLLGVSALMSQPRCVEVGIMLLKPFHRSGIAQKALMGLCATVFSVLPDVTIVGKIDPQNSAAKKLVAKLGFVYCSATGCYNLQAGSFQFQEKHRGS